MFLKLSFVINREATNVANEITQVLTLSDVIAEMLAPLLVGFVFEVLVTPRADKGGTSFVLISMFVQFPSTRKVKITRFTSKVGGGFFVFVSFVDSVEELCAFSRDSASVQSVFRFGISLIWLSDAVFC